MEVDIPTTDSSHTSSTSSPTTAISVPSSSESNTSSSSSILDFLRLTISEGSGTAPLTTPLTIAVDYELKQDLPSYEVVWEVEVR